MPVRIGFLSTAHLHAWGYASGVRKNPDAKLVGIWDRDSERTTAFSRHFETTALTSQEALFEACDAVVICSENRRHAEDVESAAGAGKHILCEKPLVTSVEERDRVFAAVKSAGVQLMTSFPCRYSPAFLRLKERLQNDEIGKIVGICATNRGRCPWGWFVQGELSGGGAMIDHTVHVADLLRILLKAEPISVQAFTGSNMYGQSWEDTAMLTLEFPGNVFATLDSSWSRPKSYKTWGDVTMNVAGEKGVIELNMFSQAFDIYSDETPSHRINGYGSDLDAALIGDFVRSIQNDRPVPITMDDGWKAVQVALAGYESARTGKARIIGGVRQ